MNATPKFPRTIVITGVSGSGKSTLTDGLLRSLPRARFMTSTTTRRPRTKDLTDEYEHVSKREFEAGIIGGEFFTYTYFSQNYYGMRHATLNRALGGKEISIRPLTPDRIPVWYERIGKKGVFLHIAAPPELEIRARLADRGSSAREITRRIHEARQWEKQIAGLIRDGIPIRIVTGDTPDAMLINAINIVKTVS